MEFGGPAQQNAPDHRTTGKPKSHLEITRFGTELPLQLMCQGIEHHLALMGKFGHSDSMIGLRLWNSCNNHIYVPRRFYLANVALATDLKEKQNKNNNH
jgi:hypothetical protein